MRETLDGLTQGVKRKLATPKNRRAIAKYRSCCADSRFQRPTPRHGVNRQTGERLTPVKQALLHCTSLLSSDHLAEDVDRLSDLKVVKEADVATIQLRAVQ